MVESLFVDGYQAGLHKVLHDWFLHEAVDADY
jgi:hypothetical protein